MLFTDKYIQSLKAKSQPYRVYERGSDKGFGIQISANSKAFFMQYKSPITDNRRFMKLGKYPDTKLSIARKRSKNARDLVEIGKDPQSERDEEKIRKLASIKEEKRRLEIAKNTGTVNELFESYITSLKKEGKRAAKDVEQIYNKDIKPSIGTQKAFEVLPSQLKDIIRKVYQRGAKVNASRTRTFLMAAYSYGIKSDNDPTTDAKVLFRIKYNPVRDIPVPAKPAPGERNLSADEIRDLWFQIETSGMSISLQNVIKLLFSTGGQRVEEVLHMQKSELDLKSKLWELSPSRTKNKKPHVIPLSDLSISLIEEMNIISDGSGYVFPCRDDKDKPIPHHSLSQAVRRFCNPTQKKIDAGIKPFPKFIPKDIRRTVKSRMGELGVSKEIRDRLQNHAMHDVSSKHYDRFDYLEPKKHAMKIWSEWLESIINDEEPENKIIKLSANNRS